MRTGFFTGPRKRFREMAVGIGIELTAAAVRGVVLEGGAKSGWRVRALQELPCDTARGDALTNALAQLRRDLGIRQGVVLGLPGTSAIVQTVTPLVTSPRRAWLGVQFELQQALPFDLPDVTWDYRWLLNGTPRPTGASPGATASALVAAVRRQVLEERLASCQRAGLTVAAASVNPVAAWNGWSWAAGQRRLTAGAEQGAILLRHISDELVEWIVASGPSFHVLPLSLPQDGHGAAITQALRTSWDALRTERPQLPTRVWVLGAPEPASRLQQALPQDLGVEAMPFDPTEALAAKPARVDVARAGTAALGLALQGLGTARRPLNFLAAAQRERTAARVTQVSLGLAGVFALVALVWAGSALLAMRSRRAAVLEALSQREAQYVALRPDIRARLQDQEALQERVRQLEAVAATRSLITQLVSRLTDTMPETVWLTKLEFTKHDGIVGLLEGRGKSFQDVTQFLDRLKQVPGIATVKPLSTTVAADPASGKEQIVFAAQLTGALTAPQPDGPVGLEDEP